jgi:hypothetical protein
MAKRKPGELPSANQALSAVMREENAQGVQAQRIVIQCLASGEVAYRIHPSKEEDYVGGVAKVE